MGKAELLRKEGSLLGDRDAALLDRYHSAPITLPFSWQEKGPGDEFSGQTTKTQLPEDGRAPCEYKRVSYLNENSEWLGLSRDTQPSGSGEGMILGVGSCGK